MCASVARSIPEINERIKRGDVVVLTAEEFKKEVREGATEDVLREVDVVTTATCGLMSGTAAIFSLEVAQRGEFERVLRAWFNGVPAFPGPCPNERLGVLDAIVFGTAHSEADEKYGGGHLFQDLVAGKAVEVEFEARTASGGKARFRRTATLEEFNFARLFTTRSAFRNYMCFVNPSAETVRTIFSVSGLRGPFVEASVCGCGELNPLENDPEMRVIRVGSRILVNAATGFVVGEGTRSTPERRNISVVADMKGMDAEFMGGFVTSAGTECITSIAVPIPVLNDAILECLKVLDDAINMPIAEIQRRTEIGESDYGCVWQGTSLEIIYEKEKCIRHEECVVERFCPTRAFERSSGLNRERCFNCGFCVFACEGGAFKGELGSVFVAGRKVPITLRLSNRAKARKLCMLLKKRIEEGEFLL